MFAFELEDSLFGRDTGMSNLILEVRAAEGGDDAKSLVALQVAIYLKLAGRRSL